jgi:cytochrome d ubiquinol oxidase subunit I
MECVYKGGPDQTEYLGGVCTGGKVKYAIGIPGLDSFLVGFSTHTDVTGLNQIPANDQPPKKTMLHLSFDTMVGLGSALMGLALWLAFLLWRRRTIPDGKWFLRAVAVSGAAAVIAMWCGWIVTEVGRQPWIVNGFMRTEDAVTHAKGLWWVYAFTVVLYLGLGVTAVLVVRRMARRWRDDEGGEVPYGPPEGEAT